MTCLPVFIRGSHPSSHNDKAHELPHECGLLVIKGYNLIRDLVSSMTIISHGSSSAIHTIMSFRN